MLDTFLDIFLSLTVFIVFFGFLWDQTRQGNFLFHFIIIFFIIVGIDGSHIILIINYIYNIYVFQFFWWSLSLS